MNFQPTTEPVQCQPGDTLAMHEGRPTLLRDGEPVAVAWANSPADVRVWDGKVQPRYGYVYATRQGTP